MRKNYPEKNIRLVARTPIKLNQTGDSGPPRAPVRREYHKVLEIVKGWGIHEKVSRAFLQPKLHLQCLVRQPILPISEQVTQPAESGDVVDVSFLPN